MPLNNNRLIISVAGSGKTTFLVNEAVKKTTGKILITTYTEANELEIRKKFLLIHKAIPANVTIQTWFSLLLQHGVKPFQGGTYEDKIKGMILVNSQSGVKGKTKTGIPITYKEEKEFKKHYMSAFDKLYSDKLSKFVIRANQNSKGLVIQRLTRIYSDIYIDEIQDLAGNDLEIIRLLLHTNVTMLMVGDPRQVTYLTHHERKYYQYKNGGIKDFIVEKCRDLCYIDEVLLSVSHRNNFQICAFSSRLYPNLKVSEPCSCTYCRNVKNEHCGIYMVSTKDVESYKCIYKPIILRHQLASQGEWNFGACKGLGFDRVLIYPTRPILNYLRSGILNKISNEKVVDTLDVAKLYVAITRARYSVAFITDDTSGVFIDGVRVWNVPPEQLLY